MNSLLESNKGLIIMNGGPFIYSASKAVSHIFKWPTRIFQIFPLATTPITQSLLCLIIEGGIKLFLSPMCFRL